MGSHFAPVRMNHREVQAQEVNAIPSASLCDLLGTVTRSGFRSPTGRFTQRQPLAMMPCTCYPWEAVKRRAFLRSESPYTFRRWPQRLAFPCLEGTITETEI